MSDMGNIENNIEFLRNEDRATCSFTQGRFISRMKKLAENFPDECQIVAENKDGSIVAHFPVKWIHITKISNNITEEERKARSDRMRELRKSQLDYS